MRPSRSRFCLVLLPVLVLLAGPALAGGPTAEMQAAAYLDKLWRSNQAPAFSAAVALRGRSVFSEGLGFADLDNMVPATGSTVYNEALL